PTSSANSVRLVDVAHAKARFRKVVKRWHEAGTVRLLGEFRLYLPIASFVLFAWMALFPREAQGQATPQPSDLSSSAPLSPGSNAPMPGPPAAAPPTDSNAALSTGVHAPPGADMAQPSGAAPNGPLELRDRRHTDAHVDRVLLVPTAETHPAGTFYL